MSAWTGATDELVGFLAQRQLAQRQAMLDAIAGEDRARALGREDRRDAREDERDARARREEEAAEVARAAAAATKQTELERQGTVRGLTGQRQASLNLAGSGDPTGAQATRDAVAVALRLAGAGDVADAGRKEDLATAAAARTAEAEAAKPKKRTFERVGDTLLEIPDDGSDPRTVYREPAKGPSEATQLAAETRALALEEKRTKIADAAAEKAAKAEDARALTTETLAGVRALATHPGLGKSQGIISSLTAPLSQDAQDFRAERDRIVAALTLPNLGALKGPMSDKDVVFVKQLATKLASDTLSDAGTVQELTRLETFLESKLGGRRSGDDLGKDW